MARMRCSSASTAAPGSGTATGNAPVSSRSRQSSAPASRASAATAPAPPPAPAAAQAPAPAAGGPPPRGSTPGFSNDLRCKGETELGDVRSESRARDCHCSGLLGHCLTAYRWRA